MFKLLGICILILAGWNPLSALQHEAIKDDSNSNKPVHLERTRTRRALGTATALWFRATQKLLYGTKKVQPSSDIVPLTRMYEKEGDFLRALKDFESVKPANVVGFKRRQESGKVGKIGNQKVILRTKQERVEGKFLLSTTIELQRYPGNFDKWDIIKYINGPR